MSMPRKAMKELGMQACCLWCDAPDHSVERCKPCIQHHRSVRDFIAAAPQDNALMQFARELIAMAASPEKYALDDVHGAILQQLRLAHELAPNSSPLESLDLDTIFEHQRQQEKTSVIRDVGNQNPWKDKELSSVEAKKIGEDTWIAGGRHEDHQYGARTIPSKPITQIDRSDRKGEDTQLTDRVHASVEASKIKEKEVAELVELVEFQQRQMKREVLATALKDVKKMIDDDLDFD